MTDLDIPIRSDDEIVCGCPADSGRCERVVADKISDWEPCFQHGGDGDDVVTELIEFLRKIERYDHVADLLAREKLGDLVERGVIEEV